MPTGLRHLVPVIALAVVAGALVGVPGAVAAPAVAPHPAGVGRYVPLAPVRVLDTRESAPVGQGGTKIVDFSASLPDLVVSAVVLNVTVTNATQAGFVTVYPADTGRPLASSLNHRAGETRANSVTVGLPAAATNQRVALFNNAGSSDLIVDLFGYYVGTTTDTASSASYYPLGNPVRTYDSRQLGVGGPLRAGQTVTIQRAFNIGGQPITQVRALAVTLTAVGPAGPGFLRAWNGDPGNVPGVSTVNFAAGQTVPNFAVVPVTCVNPPTCSAFSFAVSNNVSSATDVVVDVVGVYAGAGQVGATYFTPSTPTRVVDTREGRGFGRLGAGGTGAASAGLTTRGLTAVNLNLTAVAPTVETYLTVYADGTSRPGSSNLNPVAGEVVADAAQPVVSSAGRFTVYNAGGSTDVVVDVTGAFRQD